MLRPVSAHSSSLLRQTACNDIIITSPCYKQNTLLRNILPAESLPADYHHGENQHGNANESYEEDDQNSSKLSLGVGGVRARAQARGCVAGHVWRDTDLVWGEFDSRDGEVAR